MKIYGCFVARDDHALTIFDLSDPANPTFKGSLRGAGSPNYLEYPRDVVVDYPYAYTITDAFADGFNIYDIRDPSNIVWKGGIHPGDAQDPGYDFQQLYRVIKSGDTVYIASYTWGLYIVDVSDPTAPLWTGSYTDRGGYHMALSGTTLYMTSADAFVILNVADPANIVELSYTSGGGSPNYLNNPRGLYKKDDTLFIASEVDDALTAWDVSDPEHPVQLGVIRGAGSPNYLNTAQLVIVRDSLAYVAVQGDHGLTIIDVATPASMSYHGGVYSTDYLWQPWGMNIYGRYAYLCDYTKGVTVVDISDPTAPTVEGNIQGAGAPYYLDYCLGMDIHIFGVKGNPNIDQLIYRHVERMGR